MSDTLLLHDDHNQSLKCEILKEIELDGEGYVLLMPVDQPIQILAWEELDPGGESGTSKASEEAEEEGGLVDLEVDELAVVLPTAIAVLEELNLKLWKSAYTLTVEGELPEPIEETVIEISDEDEEDIEEYQLLSTFFHEEKQFGIFAPLDPLLFFAVQPADGDPYMLDPEAPNDLFTRLQDRLLDLAE